MPSFGVEKQQLPGSDYYLRIEQLANDVCERALEEGWLTYRPEDGHQTPLQRAINKLARSLRHVHHDGDDCLSDD